MSTTKITKADLIATLVAAGRGSESGLRRRTLADLTAMAAEQAENAVLPAEQAVQGEAPAEAVEQPENAAQEPDATKDWHGNYNTVMVPFAEDVAGAFPELTVWVENVSAMLRRTHVAGPDAAGFVVRLAELEEQAQVALRTWQKGNVEPRRGLTEMQKYNQHRAFLAGFGQAVAATLAGKKVTSKPVRFAKDIDKAMAGAERALKDGLAAGKEVSA